MEVLNIMLVTKNKHFYPSYSQIDLEELSQINHEYLLHVLALSLNKGFSEKVFNIRKGTKIPKEGFDTQKTYNFLENGGLAPQNRYESQIATSLNYLNEFFINDIKDIVNEFKLNMVNYIKIYDCVDIIKKIILGSYVKLTGRNNFPMYAEYNKTLMMQTNKLQLRLEILEPVSKRYLTEVITKSWDSLQKIMNITKSHKRYRLPDYHFEKGFGLDCYKEQLLSGKTYQELYIEHANDKEIKDLGFSSFCKRLQTAKSTVNNIKKLQRTLPVSSIVKDEYGDDWELIPLTGFRESK